MVLANKIKPITLDEFIEFALRPENADQKFEFINGEIIPMSPGRTTNSFIEHLIAVAVHLFCRAQNPPCFTSGGDGAYEIGGQVIAPDFAYKRTPMIDEYPDPEPPLWVVEIISPKDRAEDIRDKRAIYLEAGILLWEIYPKRREVDIYAPDQSMRTVSIDGELDAGNVLPGFRLPLKDLFPTSV